MYRFEIFATESRVRECELLRPEDLLDVVLDSFEPFESFEVLVSFPCVVDVTVVLPLDEEHEVALRFILLVRD
jgi:hypothetical protein